METHSPDVADLRAFCLVVDQGSFTAAARILGETKGTISKRLTRLERIVGVRLLRRSPRSVQPTEDGAQYRVRVGRVLELLDEAQAVAQHASATATGHLRVTAPYDLATGVFAPQVEAFSRRYPEISVEMVLTDVMLDFDGHQIDVALRASTALRDSALIAHKLVDMEGGLYASPDYLSEAGSPSKPAELGKHRILAVHASRGVASLELQKRGSKRRHKVRVRTCITATDFGFCREAALAGGGIAELPSLVAQLDAETGGLVPVLGEYVLFRAAAYLVHSATRFLPPRVRVFRDFMLDAFARRAVFREET